MVAYAISEVQEQSHFYPNHPEQNNLTTDTVLGATHSHLHDAYQAAKAGNLVSMYLAMRQAGNYLENDSMAVYEKDILELFRSSSTGKELEHLINLHLEEAGKAGYREKLDKYLNLTIAKTYFGLLGRSGESTYVESIAQGLEPSLRDFNYLEETLGLDYETPISQELRTYLSPDTELSLPQA
ncbi:MAG: hypothetical protein ABIG93_00300 [archaeon]|nr:hypothetical protein [Nanoarchaeota archaeon]